jgi:two-component system response regulator YesN
MIRAIIVDDEKITRKGMMSVIPWERFGIEIVADLGSAGAALSFLQEHPVDLAFVDVAMPGMNGIQLIREMRARGQECTVVVLTFYDNFEYVQEALRLGASDYVLKTQLDDEKVLQMLDRVTRTMAEGRKEHGRAPFERCALVELEGETAAARSVVDSLSLDPRTITELSGGEILVELTSDEGRVAEAARVAGERGVALIRLAGADRLLPEALAGIGAMLRTLLFYDSGPGGSLSVIPVELLLRGPREISAEDIEMLRAGWSSAHWLLLDARYNELMDLTARLRVPLPDLEAVLSAAAAELAHAFPMLKDGLLRASTRLATWSQWGDSVQSVRQEGKERVRRLRHSTEIVTKVLDAVDIIRTTNGRYVKEEVVAARVGLSRSYFSHCFKDITGSEFKRYLIDKSVAEARSLLLRTEAPFRSISAQLGYQNEGHFSRTFQAATGLSPREFRSKFRT